MAGNEYPCHGVRYIYERKGTDNMENASFPVQGALLSLPPFPEIDTKATGEHIRELRMQRGCSVEMLSKYLRLSSPRSIYYWQSGQTLPSVDSLYAMSRLFEISVNDILIEKCA